MINWTKRKPFHNPIASLQSKCISWFKLIYSFGISASFNAKTYPTIRQIQPCKRCLHLPMC